MLVYVLFYLGQLSHCPSCCGAGATNLNEPPSSFFAPSSSLRVGSWLRPFKGHCEQQAMRDDGVIYVAGHPLLNRRCTRLPGCICLRNDLYCVGWGVTLYSLTHPLASVTFQWLWDVLMQQSARRYCNPKSMGYVTPTQCLRFFLLISRISRIRTHVRATSRLTGVRNVSFV